MVGGLARTVMRDGYRFDLGGHRFFTKSPEVEALWLELLGAELLAAPRLSRIYWRGRLIDYPLRRRRRDAQGRARRGRSQRRLLRGRAAAPQGLGAENFEEWVTQRFGRRLFELFFRSYTEKVWGVPTTEIRAEWAAQRIRGLSLGRAVRAAALGDGGEVRSLIEEFHYPRLGPGQMWERMATEIDPHGRRRAARRPGHADRPRRAQDRRDRGRWRDDRAVGRDLFPAPRRRSPACSTPSRPPRCSAASSGLRYRDFLTVALVVEGSDPFPDNWIYIHDPQVKVGRIQNFRAWSPAMVPDEGRSCLGLEYFCFEGDELWNSPDERLVELAASELERTGLVSSDRVVRGYVVRVPKAYPIYDAEYARRLETLRGWLAGLEGLQQVGRNGLHRYNNSDHSMLTALRAVDNICRREPATTSGRSTPTTPITRSPGRPSSRTARRRRLRR